jgi:hypothetical protein
MENPFAALSLVASVLEQQGITYVLVGSLASSMHGMYRSTVGMIGASAIRLDENYLREWLKLWV